MANNGWIKLHRQIQDNEFLWDSKEEPFDRRSAWIDLLLMANYEDKRTYFNMSAITVKAGQRITSIRKLAERWMWSTGKVIRFLDLLQNEGMIVRQSDTKKTLITIVNYGFYQDQQDTNGTQTIHRRHTDGTQTTLNNNIKNIKKVKKEGQAHRKDDFCDGELLNENKTDYMKMFGGENNG